MALQRLREADKTERCSSPARSWQGRRWVVETDIADRFGAIPHDKLMQAVEDVCEQGVLHLLRVSAARWGDAGGPGRRPVAGTRRVGSPFASALPLTPDPGFRS